VGHRHTILLCPADHDAPLLLLLLLLLLLAGQGIALCWALLCVCPIDHDTPLLLLLLLLLAGCRAVLATPLQ
jgi:hypothetical protein